MDNDKHAPLHEKAAGIDWSEVRRRMEHAREDLGQGPSPTPGETRAILEQRARALAREPARDESTLDFIEVVEFRLSQETYGMETGFVRELYPLKDLAPLPCTPSFVLGIVNVRGQIVSVVDLKKFFNLPDRGLGDLNKIIIIRDEKMEFGILADVILGTRRITPDSIREPLSAVAGIRAEYVKGVCADGTIVLDGGGILNDNAIVVHDETGRDASPVTQRRNI